MNTPRIERFFGLHFDLHPERDDTELGADTAEENILELLDRARPDFVQYDCKGHPGYTGYPTKVGWPAKRIVNDALAVWRSATRRRGVGLYIHYSGVLDAAAVEHHPDWAAVDVNGRPYMDGGITSTFGPYVDELMIPQLIEVIEAYDLDGVWADGESWGARLDYSPPAVAAWREATGRDDAPRDATDPDWPAWKEFHRDRFEAQACHWIDAVHAAHPSAELCSNWMYSIAAPRPVKAKVDFLSGDYSPLESVDTARRQARYLASTGMPWDLMAWGFIETPPRGHYHKHPLQLQQEAGVVLMAGGGVQVYLHTTRRGRLVPEVIDMASAVADFCHERKDVSFRSTTVPQVAILFSTSTLWQRSESPYDPEPEHLFAELHGALHALLELHYSVDILAEHQLVPRLDDFPLVIVPHAEALADEVVAALRGYVHRGGRLMLCGAEAAGFFEAELGVTFVGVAAEAKPYLEAPGGSAPLYGLWREVTVADAEVVTRKYATRDTSGPGAPAATVAACGRGMIGAIYGPLSRLYSETHHHHLRAIVGQLAGRLFPDPAVTVNGPAGVDIALRRTADGRLCLHLLNTHGSQRAAHYFSADDIRPTGPFTVRLKCERNPDRVRWVPEADRELDWNWRDGWLEIKAPGLFIHGVIVVENDAG